MFILGKNSENIITAIKKFNKEIENSSQLQGRLSRALSWYAIQYGEANSIQIIETSDPLFATILAFFIFGDRLSEAGMVGATLIMMGLLIALYKPDWFKQLMRIK